MKEYGYCRISTAKQSIDRQIRNIKLAYPDAHIVQETYTGTTTARPKFDNMINMILNQREPARIIFDSVSRMSRDAEEGFKLYQQLYDAGIDLVFLKEPHINTSTYKASLERSIPSTETKLDLILDGVNAFLMELAREQIRMAFAQAQKEVDDLRQRTREGIETARLGGKQIGQQPGKKLNVKKAIKAKQVIRDHSIDFGGSLSDQECMILCGISRNTYYKYKRELREESNRP